MINLSIYINLSSYNLDLSYKQLVLKGPHQSFDLSSKKIIYGPRDSKIAAYIIFVTKVMHYNTSFYFVQRHMNFGIWRQTGGTIKTNLDIKNLNNLEEYFIFGLL